MNLKTISLSIFTSLLLLLTGCDSGTILSGNSFKVTFYEFETPVFSFNVKENSYISSTPSYIKISNFKSSAYKDLIFNGWYTKNGQNYSDVMITEDTNFYANYSVAVNFYFTSFSSTYDTKTYNVGTILTEKDYPIQPIYMGIDTVNYKFLYWSENKDASEKTRNIHEFNNVITNKKGTLNLYPIYYEAPYYNITLYTDTKKPPVTKRIQEYNFFDNDAIYDSYYEKFLYWSESCANETEAKAKKIKSNIVEKDLTLYGIFTPNYFYIKEITKSSIKIKISTLQKEPYTFSDGSIPEISISCENQNFSSIPLNIRSTTMEKESPTSSNYFVTYTFDAIPADTYTFKVTNTFTTKTQNVVLAE